MKTKTIMAAVLFIAFCEPSAAQLSGGVTRGGCIDVATPTARVVARGTLMEGTFTDPYGTERALILQLPRSVCIDDGDEFSYPADRFRRVHVSAVNDRLLRILRRFLGRTVSVRGEGFAAHTRHHHAPLVVIADQVTVE
jgi:hypothetical protein